MATPTTTTAELPPGLQTVDEALHRTRFRRFRALPFLGPAFIACVAYLDPGNFATNIAGGSRYGYRLVWVIVAANLMAMLIQTLSAKLGIASRHNLPEVCREQFSRRTSFLLWSRRRLIAMATDLAEFLGAAIGIHLLTGMSLFPAAVIAGVASFADPRAAALRRPPARGGDRDARRRDRRLLHRRARSRAPRLGTGARARRRAPVRQQRCAAALRRHPRRDRHAARDLPPLGADPGPHRRRRTTPTRAGCCATRASTS